MSNRVKQIFLAVTMLMSATINTRAQGYGFYVGDKYVQLNEGDRVTFSENKEQSTEQGEGSFVTDIKVETTDGQITVYQASQIVFQGDIENYFQAMPLWFRQLGDGATSAHYAWGYGSIMHIRDMMTADMSRNASGYNWYSSWEANDGLGRSYMRPTYVYSYYQCGIAAANGLIEALKPVTALTTDQQAYLSVAYAFRALNYLEMAQMYEYLPTEATNGHEFGGNDVTGLTVPIIREGDSLEEKHPRATREEMVEFILSDLAQAESHIADRKRDNKMAPNLYCVYGLYARLYMWIGDYQKAALYAGKVVEESGLEPLSTQELVEPKTAFNDMNARSWMWGIAPSSYDAIVGTAIENWGSWMCNESTYGYAYYAPVMINPDLANMMGSNDVRRAQFKLTGQESHVMDGNFDELPLYSSLKFRPYQGACNNSSIGALAHYPVMRLEEMYFIQAEALIRCGQVEAGKKLLENFIKRYRDPGFSFSAELSEEKCLDILFDQKRIELWGEGQLFFDYKRLNKSVDRYHISTADNIWPSKWQYITNGRPAWMNMVIPATYYLDMDLYSYRSYSTFMDGYYNPDPSNYYVSGTTELLDKKSLGRGYYASELVENFLFDNSPSVLRPVKYEVSRDEKLLYVSTLEGQELFRIEVDGNKCTIPEQTVLFEDHPVAFKAEGGLLSSQTITFYSDGIWMKDEEKSIEPGVQRSSGIKFYLPEEVQNYTARLVLYFGTQMSSYPMSVIQKDGKYYLHAYIYSLTPEDISAKAYVGAVALNSFEENGGYGSSLISETEYSNYLAQGCPYTLVRDGAEGSFAEWDGLQRTPGEYIDVPIEGTITGNEQNIHVFLTSVFDGAVASVTEYSIPYPEYLNTDEGIYFLTNEVYAETYGKVEDLDSDTNAFVSVGQVFGEHVDAAYAFAVPADMTREEAAAAFKENRYETVEFELTHSNRSTIAFKVPVRERGRYKVATVAVRNGEVVKVAFSSTFDYKLWESIGWGKFADWFLMENAPYEVEFMQNIQEPNRFRIMNPYSQAYNKEWGSYGIAPSKYLEFTVLKAGDELNGVTITNDNLVYFEDVASGFYSQDYSDNVYVRHPSKYGQSATEEFWIHNRVIDYQENGLPAHVQLAPYYVMYSVGKWNRISQDNVIEISFPGVPELVEEWIPQYVGTFRYSLFFGSEEKPYDDEGLVLSQSSLNENRYKVEHAFYDVDFIFEVNSDGTICFDDQLTGYVDATEGDVYVTDMHASYPDEFEPSFYWEGVFTFSIGYYTGNSWLNYGTETFTLTGNAEAKAQRTEPKRLNAQKSIQVNPLPLKEEMKKPHAPQAKGNSRHISVQREKPTPLNE